MTVNESGFPETNQYFHSLNFLIPDNDKRLLNVGSPGLSGWPDESQCKVRMAELYSNLCVFLGTDV